MAKRIAKNVVGGRIRIARQHHKPALTQDALSGKLANIGVTLDRAGIAKVEAGTRFVRDYELRALCEILSVSPGWLLGMTSRENARLG